MRISKFFKDEPTTNINMFNIYAVYLDPRYGFLTEDEYCKIGWNEELQTFFFMSSFVFSEETGEPLVWIGSSGDKYFELDDFLTALRNVVKSPHIRLLIEILNSLKKSKFKSLC